MGRILNIIAIDPGVMTGFTYAMLHEGQLFCYPFQMPDEVDDFWRRLHEFAPNVIIMEDFEFRGRASTGLNLFPCQLIGIARLYELIEATGRCALYLQSASYGKQYYSDTLLKKAGVYKRGIPHGMDSLRHLLQWATFGPGFQFIDDKKKAKMLDSWEQRFSMMQVERIKNA